MVVFFIAVYTVVVLGSMQSKNQNQSQSQNISSSVLESATAVSNSKEDVTELTPCIFFEIKYIQLNLYLLDAEALPLDLSLFLRY
jgi:hypothetical protein